MIVLNVFLSIIEYVNSLNKYIANAKYHMIDHSNLLCTIPVRKLNCHEWGNINRGVYLLPDVGLTLFISIGFENCINIL